jgi:hypothetical protein
MSRCARHALRGCHWPFEKCLQCRVLPHFKFPRSASVQGENGLDVALQQGLLLPPVCTFRPCSGFDGALRSLPRLLVAGAGTGHFGRSPFPARVRSTFCSTFTSLARLELGDPGRAHSLCHLRGASSTSALRIAVRRRPPSAGAVLQQRHHRLRGRAARAWREYQHEARISKSRRAPGVEGRLEGRCRRRCGGTCGGIIPPPQFRGSRRRWRLRPRLHHRRGGQWRKHPGPHHRRLTSRCRGRRGGRAPRGHAGRWAASGARWRMAAWARPRPRRVLSEEPNLLRFGRRGGQLVALPGPPR